MQKYIFHKKYESFKFLFQGLRNFHRKLQGPSPVDSYISVLGRGLGRHGKVFLFWLTFCFIYKYRISLLIVVLRNEEKNTEIRGTSSNDKHICIKHLYSFHTELITKLSQYLFNAFISDVLYFNFL